MPTIKEMATITITPETRRKQTAALSVIAEAMRTFGQAIARAVEVVVDALRDLVNALLPGKPRAKHTYPGVDSTFAHRGAKMARPDVSGVFKPTRQP